jgi:hypothetical protein
MLAPCPGGDFVKSPRSPVLVCPSDLLLFITPRYSASPIDGLFLASNALWSLGTDAAATLFEGGSRSAAVAAARPGYAQSLAVYRQTVLTAFQQVEDALSNLRILAHQAKAEQAAVKDAGRAVQIALNEYQAGTLAYTMVVTAHVTLFKPTSRPRWRSSGAACWPALRLSRGWAAGGRGRICRNRKGAFTTKSPNPK